MALITCPICFNDNTSIFIEGLEDVTFKTTKEKFNLYSCPNCDAKFQYPFIPENVVGKYYPNTTYHPFQLNKPISHKSKHYPQSIYLRLLLNKHKPEDSFSLIDVGCGGGTFLMSVKKYFPNAQLMGIDVSDTAVQNLKTIQIECICSSLYDFEVNKKFDYITSSQVLEHLNQPYLFLKKIKELADPESVIMIDVPASDSYSAKKYNRNWVHWDLPRHSILYSEKTLNFLFKDFTTLELKHAGSIAALLSSYKISKGENVFTPTLSERIKLKLSSFAAKLFKMNFLFSDKLVWIGKIQKK